jgi:hypothetical protein
MSSLITADRLQAVFQRLDQFERELVDIRKTLNSDPPTNGDNPVKRKNQANSEDCDVESKKAKKSGTAESTVPDQISSGFVPRIVHRSPVMHSDQSTCSVHFGEAAQILEQGRIFFFFRPKDDLKEVHSFAEVQRLYLLLCPGVVDKDSVRTENGPKRLIVVGGKKLPDAEGFHSCSWCSVLRATSDTTGISAALGAERHVTAVDVHHSQPARPCGEGVYALVQYPRHVHLAYALQLPTEIGEVQHSLNIDNEFSFIFAVKNPTSAPPSVFPSTSKPENFPPSLIAKFAGRAWLPATPEFLGVEGAELLMIGTSRHVATDLGEVGSDLKELRKLDLMKGSDAMFDELKLLSTAPQEPLTQGTWM